MLYSTLEDVGSKMFTQSYITQSLSITNVSTHFGEKFNERYKKKRRAKSQTTKNNISVMKILIYYWFKIFDLESNGKKIKKLCQLCEMGTLKNYYEADIEAGLKLKHFINMLGLKINPATLLTHIKR